MHNFETRAVSKDNSVTNAVLTAVSPIEFKGILSEGQLSL